MQYRCTQFLLCAYKQYWNFENPIVTSCTKINFKLINKLIFCQTAMQLKALEVTLSATVCCTARVLNIHYSHKFMPIITQELTERKWTEKSRRSQCLLNAESVWDRHWHTVPLFLKFPVGSSGPFRPWRCLAQIISCYTRAPKKDFFFLTDNQMSENCKMLLKILSDLKIKKIYYMI